MRVLITNPPWIFRKGMSLRFGVRTGSRWPYSYELPTPLDKLKNLFRKKSPWPQEIFRYVPYPIFMGYATSFLRSQGIDAVFYDAAAEFHNYRTFYKTVDSIKPDIVIQETAAASYPLDLAIAEKLHEKYAVCLAGPQATACALKLAELPYVDYVLKGAYEYSALKMIQTQRKGIYDYDVADLNELPYPYRDKTIISHYRDFNCRKKLNFPQLWAYASRGCAYQCDFCLWVNVMFNKKLSLRTPENIITEVDNMRSTYGFKHVYFDDDCWNIGPEDRLIRIADGMQKIGLPWTINARLDLSTKEMFRYFTERGCVGLRVGVESLSQRLLDISHKDLRVENILDKIRYLEKLDVELYLLFMHYVPGETASDRQEQEARIRELGHRFQNPPCIAFPGTPYYQKMLEAGLGLEKVDWREFDAGNLGKKLLETARKYSERAKE